MKTQTNQLVRIESLMVDTAYQRPINKNKIARLLKTFDWLAVVPPLVNYRNGGDVGYIVDGQHTVELLRLKGETTIQARLCTPTISQQEEADEFVKCNKTGNKSNARPLVVFRADLCANNPEAIDIENVLQELRLKLQEGADAKAPGIIMSVMTLRDTYKALGKTGLRLVLSFLQGTFGSKRSSFSPELIYGVARLYKTFGESVDWSRLQSQLRRETDPDDFYRLTRSKKSGNAKGTSFQAANVLLDFYNKGLKIESEKRLNSEKLLERGAMGALSTYHM